MKTLTTITAYFLLFLVACQSISPINIVNHTSHPVIIKFQRPFEYDSTIYEVGSEQNKLIESIALRKVAQDQRSHLISVLVKSTTDDQAVVLRFSRDLLESMHWTLDIPLPNADSTKLDTSQILDELRTLDRESYYRRVQQLYNSQQFAQSLKAIEFIRSALTGRRMLLDRSTQVAEIDKREEAAMRDGFFLLGYLSALKTHNLAKAGFYWKQIAVDDPPLAEFLNQFDFEISQHRAG
jgi:hypothetical protein